LKIFFIESVGAMKSVGSSGSTAGTIDADGSSEATPFHFAATCGQSPQHSTPFPEAGSAQGRGVRVSGAMG
jgi:hypothetical protein